MIDLDEDALVCDLAETYHVLDYRSLPVKLVATLSVGLRDDSRIKLKAANMPVSQNVLLLASIADRIELFRYSFSKDAKTGVGQPKSLVDMLCGQREKTREIVSFASPDAFIDARAKILRKITWQEQN